jgi:hypothetical protein
VQRGRDRTISQVHPVTACIACMRSHTHTLQTIETTGQLPTPRAYDESLFEKKNSESGTHKRKLEEEREVKSFEDGTQVDCSELQRGSCRCRLSMHWHLPRHTQAPHAASSCVSPGPDLLITDSHGSSVTVGLACSFAVASAFCPAVPLSHESAPMHRACPSRSICASFSPAMSLRSQCDQDRRKFVLSFGALAASQVLPLSPLAAKAEDEVSSDEQVPLIP